MNPEKNTMERAHSQNRSVRLVKYIERPQTEDIKQQRKRWKNYDENQIISLKQKSVSIFI